GSTVNPKPQQRASGGGRTRASSVRRVGGGTAQGYTPCTQETGARVSSKRLSAASQPYRDRALLLAAEAPPLGYFEVDLSAHRVYWSPEMHEILGVPADTVAVLGVDDVPDHVHPDDRGRIALAIRRSHDPSSDGSFETEHRVLRPGGEVRWV